MKNFVRGALSLCWAIAGRLIPKSERLIVFASFPDFDDTFKALSNAAGRRDKTLAVLANRPEARRSLRDSQGIIVARKYSVRGFWLYHRAGAVIFTHGLFSGFCPNPRQVVVNVWHGTPIKNIGFLDGKDANEVPKSHYVVAESEAFRDVMSKSFGVSPTQVIINPHPRVDVLFSRPRGAAAGRGGDSRLVVWLPTYRVSDIGDVRRDGDPSKDVLSGSFDLSAMDDVLRRHNAECVIKPHPMASFSRSAAEGLSKIRILTDADLKASRSSLYELLSGADVLITDLSSVYFDFKRTGRPVVLFFPDRSQYESNRGLVAPIEELVNERVSTSMEEFLLNLNVELDALGAQPRSVTSGTSSEFSFRLLDTIDNLVRCRSGLR